jgi:hypothetical protein
MYEFVSYVIKHASRASPPPTSAGAKKAAAASSIFTFEQQRVYPAGRSVLLEQALFRECDSMDPEYAAAAATAVIATSKRTTPQLSIDKIVTESYEFWLYAQVCRKHHWGVDPDFAYHIAYGIPLSAAMARQRQQPQPHPQQMQHVVVFDRDLPRLPWVYAAASFIDAMMVFVLRGGNLCAPK